MGSLIELAERWRRAGKLLRRRHPERFAAHLEALELRVAEDLIDLGRDRGPVLLAGSKKK